MFKSSFIVMIINMLSRILGLVRDMFKNGEIDIIVEEKNFFIKSMQNSRKEIN